jgi:DNA-binding MarR family transcriptional regulator
MGADDVEHVTRTLPQRALLLSRLFFREIASRLSRTDAGVLVTLNDGPRRITELAEREGLAQPTMTLVVKRLEERGWVARRRDEQDGRVVLVSLTDDGRSLVAEIRAEHRAVVRDHLGRLRPDQVEALVAASDALVPLIRSLQRPVGG